MERKLLYVPQSGFVFVYTQVRSDAYFGEGSGDILLSSIQCAESDVKLYECVVTRNTAGVCVHAEDVGVECSIGDVSCIQFSQNVDLAYYCYRTTSKVWLSLKFTF